MNVLCKLLHKSGCSFDGCNEEHIQLIIEVALSYALFMDNMMISYHQRKGYVHCFGKLLTVIDKSLQKDSNVASPAFFISSKTVVYLSVFCRSLLGCSGLNNLAKVTGLDKH